jgi:hypothetical protein
MSDLSKLLSDLELTLQRSATRCDPALLERLIAPDFREVGSSGRFWTRSDIIAALLQTPAAAIESRDMRCETLAPGLAHLTYISVTQTQNQPVRTSFRSSLWRLEGGAWRIFFHQATPLAS